MKRASISKCMKSFTAGLLSATLVLAGAAILPATAEAAYAAEDKVLVEARKDDFTAWQKQEKNAKTAPVMDGYLFGGWYKDAEGKQPMTVDEAATYTETAYAKFVPSYVLSIKAQVSAGAHADDGDATSIRLLTGLDSVKYQCVGAQISLGNQPETKSYEKTKVYDTVKFGNNTVKATETFGAAAQYYGVWKIANIADANDNKIIYVRPYWVTMDGTTVYGLAKYVHVEDGYLGYVSVPINVMSGKSVAAGLAEMGYDSNKLQIIENGVEPGRLFDGGIEVNTSITGSVKIAGNGKTAGTYKDESILANVRFNVIDGSKLFVEDSTDKTVYKRNQTLTFGINDTSLDFINWDENKVDNPGVWDIQY